MMLLKPSHTHTHTGHRHTVSFTRRGCRSRGVLPRRSDNNRNVNRHNIRIHTYRVSVYIYIVEVCVPPTIAPSQKKKKNRPATLARPVYGATAFQILSVVYRCTFPSRFRPSSYTWGYADVSRTDCRPTEISTIICLYLCGS